MPRHLSTHMSRHMSGHISTHMSGHMSTHMSGHMSGHMLKYMPKHMPEHMPGHMSGPTSRNRKAYASANVFGLDVQTDEQDDWRCRGGLVGHASGAESKLRPNEQGRLVHVRD